MEQRPNVEDQSWGAVATIVWGILILCGAFIIQSITVAAYIVVTKGAVPSNELSALASELKYDGRLLSWCTFAAGIASVLATIVIVQLKHGSKIASYLGLRFPSLRQLLVWLGVLIMFVAVSDGISVLLGKPTTPEYMVKTYASLQSPWILWVALLIAAPLSEELFFRGFLIRGLSASIVRWYGAVFVSSAIWAAIHLQYDLYTISNIFVLGCILGTARYKTGSTILTILLHSFTNLLATTEVAIHLRNLAT